MTIADSRNGSNVLIWIKREISDGRGHNERDIKTASPIEKNGKKARCRLGENFKKLGRFHEKVTEGDNHKF